MKKRLLMLAFLLSQPAFGQEAPSQDLSPLQQYLYNESGGYAPGVVPQQQAVAPQPVEPYTTAYAPPVAEQEEYYEEPKHNLNDGVRGMNF